MRALPLAHMRSCPAATTRSIASDIAGRLGQVLVCFLAVLLLVFAFPQQALAESAACTALNSDFGNGATITISPPIGSADSRDEGYGAAYGDAEDFEVGETITWSASSSNSGNENIYFTLGSNANTLVYFDNAGGTEFNESGSFQLNDSVDGVILTVYGSVDNTGQNPPSSLDFSIRCDGVAPPVPEPTITSVVPDQGPEAGGTTVIITGTDLTGATSATFGGTPATSYTVDSDTQITATTPPGTAGAVDAVVTTPGGSATLVRGFTYTTATLPELSIDDVTVSEGDGNAVFTITLSAPAGPGGVTFTLTTADGTAIAGDDYHSFDSSTTISEGVDTYYHAVGLIDDAIEETDETFFLDVSNVTGATLAKARGTATIQDNDASVPPTITAIAPNTGPMAGGTTVTITGTNLTGATAVAFGSNPATNVTVDSATQITAVTPAGAAGAVDVSVTTPGGTGTQTGGFTYEAPVLAPTVSSVAVPANGYYRAGDVLSFTVNFSDNVIVGTTGGTPRIGLTIGTATRYADYAGGSGSNALVFQHVVNAGDQDLDGIAITAIDANGGTIANTGDTPANLTLNNVGSTSNVLVYTAEPTILSTQVTGSPPSNATSVTFEIVFSEAVTGLALGDLSLATTDTAAATLADLQTSDNITYTVAANGITGTGTLRLDVAANAVANIAGIGNPAYSGGTDWVVAPSDDATLADLVPSTGTLDPAFDPATTGYGVAVDNATDSITLTPTATGPNAAITVGGQTVASGSASQQIALAVGTTAIPVVVTAEDNATTRTYTVTVTRTASTNARLAGLAPSTGTLNPVFSADTLDYDVAVANAVEHLALTPTADGAGATITVDGQSVASGRASQAVALAVGSTAIPVVVTAEDGTTILTYTVTVERAQPVPTVISRTIEITAGETASVDLTEGASGGPFTDAAIVDLSDADAGTAQIERDDQIYRLVFASSPTYAGDAVLRFTLSNATGTSEPGTITLTIIGRPDPSQDPEVIGLLSAQADAARRFARVQTRNFNDRLEQLHDEGDRRRNSMNVRLGIVQSDRTSRAEREIQRMIEDGHGANAENVVQGLLAYGPEGATGARSSSGDENGAPATTFASPDLGSFAVWTGGFVNFGERENGGLDIDHTMVGLSGGVDYRFSDKFVAGFGAGYGRDRSDIGGNGTESRASAYSAAIYGSYKPFRNVFIDGLIGGSWLDFDSNRYITSTGDFASGTRSGHQFFGSVTAAYDYRDDTWLISPYGRIEFSRSWLDGFTEKGSDSMALRYGDQTVDSVSGVLGLRAEYTFMLDWGTLTPGARFEYTHDFIGSSRAHLGYADLGGLPYVVEIESAEQNYATLGLSLDATLPQDWSLGFDYRTSLGRDQQDHAIGLRVGKKF